jgi:outer membrane protein assembly factor BamB
MSFTTRVIFRLTFLSFVTILSLLMAINIPKTMGSQTNGHQLADTPWPMHKQNPQRTGQSPHAGITELPAILWQTDLQTLYTKGITIGISDTVYATNRLHTFDLWTGDPIHTLLPPSSGCGSTPVHSQNGNLYYSMEFALIGTFYNGAPIFRWPYGTGCNGSSGVIDENGVLYTQTNSYGIIAIDLSTLEIVWQDLVPAFANPTAPALGINNTVYYNGHIGKITARLRDGTFLWQSQDRHFRGMPVIADNGTVYAYSHDTKNLSAFDPMTGHIQWQYEIVDPYHLCGNGEVSLGPDGTLYFTTCSSEADYHNLFINALNPNGTLKWQHLVHASEIPWIHFSRNAPTTDSAGNVYFCVDFGRCYAYDENGYRLWDIAISDWLNTSETIQPSTTIAADGFMLLPHLSGIMAIITAEYQAEIEPNTSANIFYSSSAGFDVSVDVPVGSVTAPTQLVLSPMTRARLLPQERVSLPLHLLVYQDRSHINFFTFAEPMHITITYDGTTELVNESGLALLHRTIDGWQSAEMSCPPEKRYKNLNTAAKTLEVTVCQSGELAVFEFHQAYLPLITQ